MDFCQVSSHSKLGLVKPTGMNKQEMYEIFKTCCKELSVLKEGFLHLKDLMKLPDV